MKKRVLIIYFSFSSQTRNVLQALADGMEEAGAEVVWEPIKPVQRMKFPIGSYWKTFQAMTSTFFRKRIAIEAPSSLTKERWDLILLGGPTWSFQPSGVVLSLLDNYSDIFKDTNVLPVISCRAYWKHHYKSLQKSMRNIAKKVLEPVVFMHTVAEPWCTIGLFLKLAGKVPESGKSWIQRYYPKYGHTRDQLATAKILGRQLGIQLISDEGLDDMHYPVPVPKRK